MTYLTILRHWKLVGLGLLALALAMQTVRLSRAHDALERCQAARVADRIVAERESREQRQTTERNVIIYRDRVKQGKTIAERIEAAPVEGNCRTPGAVMGADL